MKGCRRDYILTVRSGLWIILTARRTRGNDRHMARGRHTCSHDGHSREILHNTPDTDAGSPSMECDGSSPTQHLMSSCTIACP